MITKHCQVVAEIEASARARPAGVFPFRFRWEIVAGSFWHELIGRRVAWTQAFRSLNVLQNATASIHETVSTGRSSNPGKELGFWPVIARYSA